MTTQRQDSVQDSIDEQELVEEQEARRERTPFLETLDRALDKGIRIEGWMSVPVLGIEVVRCDISIFVASCETYLDYAEEVKQTVTVVEMELVEYEQLPRP